ncbi:MAG TPA: acetyl-CoA C-acyltransferase [Pseudomonadota bacterium]|nr:acetyl-CoA C-acyltransferase [Pseudomonadota bacterium]
MATRELQDALVLAAVRSPIGRYRGALKDVRADDLLGQVIAALVAKTGIDPAQIDDVIAGCANQAGEDNRNVARMALLLAGLPQSVPGVTVNRLCGSGLEAVLQASRAIAAGQGDLYVAAGVESMTRAPLVLGKPDTAFVGGNQTMFDTSLGWRFPNPAMARLFPLEAMGETAENLVERYQISRADQDAFALRSHQRAVAAQSAGWFGGEIVPITTPAQGKERPAQTVTVDEGPRADSSLEKLGKLGAAFRAGGSVTAGNSSTLNDGAAALLIGSPTAAARLGLRPLARIVGGAAAGVDPRYMGIGPVPALRKLVSRTGVSLSEVSRFELNEAFAAQALSVLRELPELSESHWQERVNVCGGAIALGHPLGCSGARISTTLVHELHRCGGRYGIATMCIGVGQGLAALFERLD